ncbi:hypothetical protein [Streptomonospora salina]|uniref:Uncharacterized protein n=1 Tax=Streptomonospora salina TaxID=104205 RepID=A0A841ECG6_9ACTN|nr:hypothetical protein [Streptomonospora salina]MBB6000094.1 hypothetical protein [Streptomonospora salina]
MPNDVPVPVIPPNVELGRLNAEYGSFWGIWRSTDQHGTPSAWCASKKPEAPHRWAPTLHAGTAAELETQMKDPPRAIGLNPGLGPWETRATGLV